MKLALFSDIHDHLPLLKKALGLVQETDALICCGDFCSPFIIKTLGSSYSKDIYAVLGNNDGDVSLLTERSRPFPQLHLYPLFADFPLGNLRVALLHYDTLARPLIACGWYDLVCFGHNHTFETGREGKTRFLNPGELSGVLTGSPTFAILDTETDSVEKVCL